MIKFRNGIVDMQAAAKSRRLQVFLCHSHGDKPAVGKLRERLLEDGFQPWFDDVDLLPGILWRDAIEQAMQSTDVVVVCLSKESVTKEGFVQNEIHQALEVAKNKPEGTIFLIPARLEECKLPRRLDDYQWVDLWQPAGYEKLCKSLQIRADHLGLVRETLKRDVALTILPRILCIVLEKARTYGAAFNLDCDIVNQGSGALSLRRLEVRMTDPYNASFVFPWNLFYKTVRGVQSKESNPQPILVQPGERRAMGIQFVAPRSINEYNWTIGRYAFDLLGWVHAEPQNDGPDVILPCEMLVDGRTSAGLKAWRTEYDALKDSDNAVGFPVPVNAVSR
jgi:hypothetical protein